MQIKRYAIINGRPKVETRIYAEDVLVSVSQPLTIDPLDITSDLRSGVRLISQAQYDELVNEIQTNRTVAKKNHRLQAAAEQAAKQDAKERAMIKLRKLGLSDDEIEALRG